MCILQTGVLEHFFLLLLFLVVMVVLLFYYVPDILIFMYSFIFVVFFSLRHSTRFECENKHAVYAVMHRYFIRSYRPYVDDSHFIIFFSSLLYSCIHFLVVFAWWRCTDELYRTLYTHKKPNVNIYLI